MDNEFSILEIAKLAGVSKTTVSRVINNRPDVNPETRKKVESIISAHDYYPNARAQAFSQQKNMTVGLVFPHDESYTFGNPYYAELMRGILGTAREKNYHVILSYFINDDCFMLVRQKKVDGLIILTPGSEHKAKLKELITLGTPVVSTSRVSGFNNLHYVAVDEYDATCKIIEYLIALGHRRIGFIGGPKTLYSSISRMRGYRAVLKKHGIPFDQRVVSFGDTSIESGAKSMRQLLCVDKKPTAVFAGSDLMAIGAKHAIEEIGLRVPEDISLVSSDATQISDYLDAPLTTMKQPTYERGRLAIEMLVNMIEGKPVESSIMLPMDIVINKTTKNISETE